MCLLFSLLSGCVSLDEAKEAMVNATNSTVDFSKSVFNRSKPHVEKALGQLGDLYAQRGAYMSDLFGDPADNKAAYENLIESCPEALEPMRKGGSKHQYIS